MEYHKPIAKKAESKTVEKPEGIFRTTLSYNSQIMLCHFDMKKGAVIPLHDHEAVQDGYVVGGKIRFKKADGSSFIAEPGTSYVFGPNEAHGAEVLEDSEVIECFAPIRPEYVE
jgi:quercetin dioxygenase-like cupin family protein